MGSASVFSRSENGHHQRPLEALAEPVAHEKLAVKTSSFDVAIQRVAGEKKIGLIIGDRLR